MLNTSLDSQNSSSPWKHPRQHNNNRDGKSKSPMKSSSGKRLINNKRSPAAAMGNDDGDNDELDLENESLRSNTPASTPNCSPVKRTSPTKRVVVVVPHNNNNNSTIEQQQQTSSSSITSTSTSTDTTNGSPTRSIHVRKQSGRLLERVVEEEITVMNKNEDTTSVTPPSPSLLLLSTEIKPTTISTESQSIPQQIIMMEEIVPTISKQIEILPSIHQKQKQQEEEFLQLQPPIIIIDEVTISQPLTEHLMTTNAITSTSSDVRRKRRHALVRNALPVSKMLVVDAGDSSSMQGMEFIARFVGEGIDVHRQDIGKTMVVPGTNYAVFVESKCAKLFTDVTPELLKELAGVVVVCGSPDELKRAALWPKELQAGCGVLKRSPVPMILVTLDFDVKATSKEIINLFDDYLMISTQQEVTNCFEQLLTMKVNSSNNNNNTLPTTSMMNEIRNKKNVGNDNNNNNEPIATRTRSAKRIRCCVS
jgi:hypothetical protein